MRTRPMKVEPIPNGAPARKRLALMRTWGLVGVVFLAIAVLAWTRVGMLNLPAVPKGVTLESSGLAGLSDLHRLDEILRATPKPADAVRSNIPPDVSPAQWSARAAAALIAAGDPESGLYLMREGVQREPANLVLSNAYRMTAFRLRREVLAQGKRDGHLAPAFPLYLDRQPIAFFEELAREHPIREVKLQLALSWVDQMLLFPALEIKAPSSVEAVRILEDLLEKEPAYVPALYARGLNHLHRPARLVWPETEKVAPDAAAQDIGTCIAIGRRVGAGSPRLQATMAMTLGDSYIKAGKNGLARSWWQIAQNLCRDDQIQNAIRRRYGWAEENVLDELEAELDRARSELYRPMTDLEFMWN